ncbi:MAG: tyrosine-type recombinase/integrase [Pseudomonadota bacterium]
MDRHRMPPGKPPKKVNLPHINAVRRNRANGDIVYDYYYRPTGRRIVGEFGSPEFLANYGKAAERQSTSDQSTIGGLLDHYRQSEDYKALSPNTRRNYEPLLADIRDAWSKMPLAVVNDASVREGIRELRDAKAQTSKRQADYLVQVLSTVLSYGVDLGRLTQNHAKGIKRLYKSNRRDKIWLPEHVHAVNAIASHEVRFVFQLAIHTGQRQGDILTLPWSAFDGTGISLRQSKTGTNVYIPTTDALRHLLATTHRRSPLMCVNTHRQPWTSSGFQSSWGKACKRAKIDGLTFQDIRGTTVTMLAEAGCSVPEICAITGHTLKSATQILETYLSRTRELATAAIVRLEDHQKQNKARS